MDNSLQGLRNSSDSGALRTLLEAEPLRDNLVSRALFPGFGVTLEVGRGLFPPHLQSRGKAPWGRG